MAEIIDGKITLLEGTKYDDDKSLQRYDLIPPGALRALAELYGRGAKKYDDRNWEKGIAFTRVYNAMNRHMQAWLEGEKCCPIDGQHHLIAVAWNAFALYTFEQDAEMVADFDDITPPTAPRAS